MRSEGVWIKTVGSKGTRKELIGAGDLDPALFLLIWRKATDRIVIILGRKASPPVCIHKEWPGGFCPEDPRF